ncbi:MCE family protein [[Mycobacterium] burgundiense]|uniref:MCE family protein n=1 Tax=[Mycobacterium] burgundiense TaxID=3064286 RepID=A0ABM9LUH4_9MYCO|nr:MCE family protein [Mycolicibacterium sp. MU0053]CAJ1504918.1 MCE family protein [Mycolicibacterium sp. MU0053]
MKPPLRRNPVVVGAVGVGAIVVLAVGALQYDKLPFFNQGNDYSGYFSEAGGITAGADVQVSGLKVGSVSAIDLDGPRVWVRFRVGPDVQLGDRTEAAIKTQTILGAKVLEVTPRGDKALEGPIPLDRTRSPYDLPEAIGDLTTAISGLDTHQLSDSLRVLAQTFQDSPPDLKIAVEGVSRFAETLNKRDDQLRNLLHNANKATSVLAERSGRVVDLIADSNALLVALRSQSQALDRISGSIAAVAEQINGFITENRQTLRPALEKLNGVLAIVDNRKEDVQESITRLNSYAMSLGESVSSAPFFSAYIANLLPGQFVQPFVDAAFSDLGLDPNVLLPSERTDPPMGQPATPALPVPFPRTGQGGEPRTTLPDAITGNPGDPRYPYREPPPAPAPGGPPPGPPAETPPELASVPEPTPSPVYEPAPNEVAPSGEATP